MANLKITLPIRGEQLTLIPGDTISSRAGKAIVTRLEMAGQEQIIWADYGSGIEQPHVEEGLLPYAIGTSIHIGGKKYSLVAGDQTHGTLNRQEGIIVTSKRLTWKEINRSFALSPEPEPQTFGERSVESRQRRHSAKGHASGWIEERLGNLNRKTPSKSYYYSWQAGEQRGKCYIPVRKMAQVQQMLRDRRSVDDVLAFLSKHTTQVEAL